MSKGMDQKKNTKKKAAKTLRREARREEGQEGRAVVPATQLTARASISRELATTSPTTVAVGVEDRHFAEIQRAHRLFDLRQITDHHPGERIGVNQPARRTAFTMAGVSALRSPTKSFQ